MINDGSTDRSEVICKEFAAADVRFCCVSQENQGVSAARNNGLALCRGECVTFIDADDMIPDDYLEKLYFALKDSLCSVSVCDVVVVDGGKETVRFTMEPQVLSQQEALNCLLTRTSINSGPCAKLFKREILNGLAFPPLKAYEDILFVVDAIDRCERIAVTSETEYRYIQNTGSAMSSFSKAPSKDIVAASEKLLDYIVKKPELDPRCFYITLSHLMQYVIPLVNQKTVDAEVFVSAAKNVCRKYKRGIMKCSAFPWKEKIVYLLFAHGWLYRNKKMTRI